MTIRELGLDCYGYVGTSAVVEVAHPTMGRLGVFFAYLDAESSPVQSNRFPLPVILRGDGIHVERHRSMNPGAASPTLPAFRVEGGGVLQHGSPRPEFSAAFIHQTSEHFSI